MTSLGEKLKEARLKQGLSLNEIASKTRIQAHLLEAIEANDLQKIPGDFFRKSFVRQYAETLGLNPEEFETVTEVHFGAFGADHPAFGETLSLPDPPDLPPLPTAGGGALPLRQVFLSLSLLIGVIAVCAVAYMSWEEFQNRERSSTRAVDAGSVASAETEAAAPGDSAPSGQAAPVAPEGVAVEQPPSVAASSEGALSGPAAPLAAGVPPAVATPAASPGDVPAKPPLEPAATDRAAPPQTAYGSGGREIRLSASALTWVRVREGEKIVYIGTIEAGQSKVVHVGETAQILTGNAGGLSVTWQGSDVGKVGPVGQVRTVILTPEGASIQAPAPKAQPEGGSAAPPAP